MSVVILTALAAAMAVLPLLLPPLPPPPLMLLFFPVGIMAALMFLAFSPSDAAANFALYTVWSCRIRFDCQGLTSADFELSKHATSWC